MKLHIIQEPSLVFAKGEHICPRHGIAHHDVYDARLDGRREQILLGAVGTEEGLEKLSNWIERCSSHIEAKRPSKQPNLFPEFCGFHTESGFKAKLQLAESSKRPINNSEILDILKIQNRNAYINVTLELYYSKIKFLSEYRQVDVIVCVIPNDLFDKISVREPKSVETVAEETPLSEEEIETQPISVDNLELDFRRALKAKCMHLNKPLQLIREATLESGGKERQDDATRAWNFCTALYYKANKTVPWKLSDDPNKPDVCYVGIGFYRSRDYRVLYTSLAQVFNELGDGVILRGSPVIDDKDDRRPYMNEEQAYNLLKNALNEYNSALGRSPGRVVVYKTSNYREAEMDGFMAAIEDMRVGSGGKDFITILDTPIRALRSGIYPPFRGTRIELDKKTHLLYTKGSVPYYKTYPGLYIPSPLEVRMVKCDKSAHVICSEILALTKMNWNNTQFDGKYPITIECARRVGQIMKYLGENDRPSASYSFYM